MRRARGALVVAMAAGLVSAAGSAAAAPARDPTSDLALGKLHYQKHEYREVEDKVRPLLYPTVELGTEESVIEAHRLLALSYFFQKKMPEARMEVVAILALRPSFELDPVLEPPVAVRFFEHIRREQESRLEELKRRDLEETERARRDEERRRAEARRRAERVYVDRRIERHSRLIALLPFGIGQVQNGDRKKAILFGVSEALLGGLSIGMWVAIDQRFPGRKFKPDERGAAEALLGVQLASGAAFWAMVIAGIVDAQVRYVPEVVRTRDLPRAPTPPGAEAAPPARPGPAATAQPAVSLVPLIGPSAYGLGVAGAF